MRISRELIQLYCEDVWNMGNVELIGVICTDPVIRHYPGKIAILNHDE